MLPARWVSGLGSPTLSPGYPSFCSAAWQPRSPGRLPSSDWSCPTRPGGLSGTTIDGLVPSRSCLARHFCSVPTPSDGWSCRIRNWKQAWSPPFSARPSSSRLRAVGGWRGYDRLAESGGRHGVQRRRTRACPAPVCPARWGTAPGHPCCWSLCCGCCWPRVHGVAAWCDKPAGYSGGGHPVRRWGSGRTTHCAWPARTTHRSRTAGRCRVCDGALVCLLVLGAAGPLVALGAFAGAMGVAFGIWAVAWNRGLHGIRFVLVGVGVAYLCGALVGWLIASANVRVALSAFQW